VPPEDQEGVPDEDPGPSSFLFQLGEPPPRSLACLPEPSRIVAVIGPDRRDDEVTADTPVKRPPRASGLKAG
jgi:hypothetical protein